MITRLHVSTSHPAAYSIILIDCGSTYLKTLTGSTSGHYTPLGSLCHLFVSQKGSGSLPPSGASSVIYEELMLEVLSSLQLKWDPEDQPYIKFKMRNDIWRVGIVTLREWFRFHLNPQTDSHDFHTGMDKDQFCRLITRMEVATSNQYRGLAIPHPVLRCIQRALAITIFARGETVARANEKDLKLLDHMLRRIVELERPDLMLIMVCHWLEIQRSPKIGGSVHVGAYVTIIADKLGVSTVGLTLSRGQTLMDSNAFQHAAFIKIQRGATNHRDRCLWRMPDGTQYPLPLPVSLSFEDKRKWFFTGPVPAVQAPPPPPHFQAPPVTGDVDMTDAPSTAQQFHASISQQFHASTSGAAPSYPPSPVDPTIQDCTAWCMTCGVSRVLSFMISRAGLL